MSAAVTGGVPLPTDASPIDILSGTQDPAADDLRTLFIRLAALEDAVRELPVIAPGDATAAVNPELQHLIEQERIVVASIRRLRTQMQVNGTLRRLE